MSLEQFTYDSQAVLEFSRPYQQEFSLTWEHDVVVAERYGLALADLRSQRAVIRVTCDKQIPIWSSYALKTEVFALKREEGISQVILDMDPERRKTIYLGTDLKLDLGVIGEGGVCFKLESPSEVDIKTLDQYRFAKNFIRERYEGLI